MTPYQRSVYRATGILAALVMLGSAVLITVWLLNPKPDVPGCVWVPVDALGRVVEMLACPEGAS